MAFHRWLYRGGRPNALARLLNAGWALLHSLGIAPNYMVTLEVTGRHSGKLVRFPLAMALVNGERYLVSMLGADANWARNVEAAGGKARLLHGVSEQVVLTMLPVSLRAPVLKAYLRRAPGARAHFPIDKDAPLEKFAEIAVRYPVYRVEVSRA